MRDLRLLPPAGAAWLAAWCAVASPDVGVDPAVVARLAWAAGVILAVAVLALTGARRGSSAAHALRAVLTAALIASTAMGLVATSAALALERRAESPLAAAADAHVVVDVLIEVASGPRPVRAPPWASSGDAAAPTFRVDAQVIGVDGVEVPTVSSTVMLELRGEELSLGTRVSFPTRVVVLPGAEQHGFQLRPTGDARVIAPPPWLGWAVALRSGLATASTALGGDGGALVPGLAIGDTAAVGVELDAAMKASSLSHLTAVSGANCAIITAAAFALAAACGLRRGVRVALALVALAGFIVLVTPQPSVVRAGAMAVVVLIAIASGRPGGGVAALSVAVVGLLVFDPWLARDYGFALSAAATAGLLLLAAPLAVVLGRLMPRPLALVLAVPVAAQLACQPILVLLDPAIAVYGVPANLLAAPAAPVATVVGLLGCLVLPVLPSVGAAFLQVAWVPATWIALVAHGTAGLPGGRLAWLPDAPGAALLTACTALALAVTFAPPSRPRLRAAGVALLAIGLAVPVGVSFGAPVVSASTRPARWDVAACDVGQGDAVLIRSAEATALVDTGPDPAALARCLVLLGVDRIDLLVLTHWDADHVGGSEAVVGRVGTVVHGPLDGDRSDRVLDPLVRGGADSAEVVAGHRGVLGDAQWRVLWPLARAAPGNDASVVVEVDAPAFRGVFLGDLGEGAQDRLLRSADLGVVDLVKVAHHGSADQSASLYERLHATIGVIGVGLDNGYGHPTDRLLGILGDEGTSVVRTDRSGTITIAAAEGGFDVWAERGDVGPGP
ncbi:competence protein ComEC [Agromyces sp. 3263]|uniref:ComEC/Rec2 family competence protein n=1 Tax=Agromyces sp. 3263 TaxID=2817750 RepID=UPI002855BDDE|nr:ComEC/Rec2 family competence protein [Agromyces sp. 3263]MDR6907072.1 competence protein ComEC [Agromyces sp. 3263]